MHRYMNLPDHTHARVMYAHEWVISRTWMCHVMHVNESGRTDEWVMLHAWTSHTAHIDELCRTYKWVMSHRWMSHAAPKTQFEKLRKMKYFTKLRFALGMTHSCICATWKTKLNFSPSHTWMSHVTHVNKSRLTDGWVMLRVRSSLYMNESGHARE